MRFGFARRLRRDERGANAIEYGLIAGLIGIGIIGSLVTTRTSLNSIFGVASGQMGSANAGASSGPDLGARAPYWQAKSLVSTVNGSNGNGPTTTYTYSDGSWSQVTKYTSGMYNQMVESWDPTTARHTYYQVDASGVMNGYQIENHAVGAGGAMGGETGRLYSSYNMMTSGVIGSTGCSGNLCYAGNTAYLSSTQPTSASDFQYFLGITPKIGG